MRHHTSTTAPAAPHPAQLTPAAQRALAQIRGRTITGAFACPIWNMPTSVWRAALGELAEASYRIEWTHGQVADDPTVTGGYVLEEHKHVRTTTPEREVSR